jgi:hypothetical protein
MKHVYSEKYNIAWFKLAECVSRGEKERALGVYRLLSHSLEDQAFAQQLAGDIFLSFNDDATAMGKYKEAAQLYEQEERFLEAAAVYEHLLTLEPQSPDYHVRLVDLYKRMNIRTKMNIHAQTLLEQFVTVGQWDKAVEIINLFDYHTDIAFVVRLYSYLIQSLITSRVAFPAITLYIQQALDAIMQSSAIHNNTYLQQLLSNIQTTSDEAYNFAQGYLKQKGL